MALETKVMSEAKESEIDFWTWTTSLGNIFGRTELFLMEAGGTRMLLLLLMVSS